MRRASPADAPVIARINVHGWQQAYQGLLPESYLQSLSIEARVSLWEERIATLAPRVRCFVAEDDEGIAGYCLFGPYRSTDASESEPPRGECGEVFALYVAPELWGTGAGIALFLHAMDDLRAGEYEAAVLWMLRGNARAARFYERCGWRPDGATLTEPFDEAGDVVATEVRYRFDFSRAPQGPT